MKVLIFVTCVLAGVSCTWIPFTSGYHGPEHVPVIKNGVPVETPEVQHAKAAHYAAVAKEVSNPHYKKQETHENNHENHYEHHGHHYEQPTYSNPKYEPTTYKQVHHAYETSQNKGYYEHHQDEHPTYINSKYDHDVNLVTYKKFPLAYETSHVVPKIGHDGTPLDTPEVESAKAHHFEAFGKALAMTAPHSNEPETHYRYRRYAPTVIDHTGVPVEPTEVQKARAEHLKAHASAHHSTSYGYSIHQVHPEIYGHHDSYEVPHIGHDGQPLDTAEVEHAKAAHFAAHHEALVHHEDNYGHFDYWNPSNDYHY